MIKLVHLNVTSPETLALALSDCSTAAQSAADLIARDTVMTRQLAGPTYFARAFIEADAVAQPNGFDLSGASLHRRLAESGTLMRPAA